MQLTALSHPLTQSLALTAISAVCLCFHRHRTAVAFALAALCWTLLCSTPAFAEMLRRGLENGYPQIAAVAYPQADAIVILGGGYPIPMHRNPNAKGMLDIGVTRTGFGLKLFRAERAPIVLLTGGDGSAIGMARELTDQGVSAHAIQLETRSLTTHEDALFSAEILERAHRKRILLVTSRWAMARAAACFRKQGLQVIPAPAWDSKSLPHAHTLWLPKYSTLQLSGRYLHEYLGLLKYKLLGWT